MLRLSNLVRSKKSFQISFNKNNKKNSTWPVYPFRRREVDGSMYYMYVLPELSTPSEEDT